MWQIHQQRERKGTLCIRFLILRHSTVKKNIIFNISFSSSLSLKTLLLLTMCQLRHRILSVPKKRKADFWMHLVYIYPFSIFFGQASYTTHPLSLFSEKCKWYEISLITSQSQTRSWNQVFEEKMRRATQQDFQCKHLSQ